MRTYFDRQLDLSENDPYYKEAQYCKAHELSLIDFDFWTHLEDLLGFSISFEDYQRVDDVIEYDLMELGKSDVPRILEILNDKPEQQKIWTVTIKDREDNDMDVWTSSFSTEEAADRFKSVAEEKLKKYGVSCTVDVIKDAGFLDDDMYLDWIDARYSDSDNPNTTPIGEDDYYFDDPVGMMFTAIYYNPDAASGGQFVVQYLPYWLILKAYEERRSVDSFFEILDEECSEELVDLGTDEYAQYLKEYADPHPLCIGRSKETMKALEKRAGKWEV